MFLSIRAECHEHSDTLFSTNLHRKYPSIYLKTEYISLHPHCVNNWYLTVSLLSAPQHLQEPPTSCSPSPLSHRRSLSPVSSLLHRKSISPMSSRPPGGAGELEMDFSPSQGPSPRSESRGDGPDGGKASRGPGSPTLRRHLVSTDDR